MRKSVRFMAVMAMFFLIVLGPVAPKARGQERTFADVVEDKTGMVFVDFLSSSPNIFLPVEQREEELVIEGRLEVDDTILNGYKVIPYAYQFVEPLPVTGNDN